MDSLQIDREVTTYLQQNGIQFTEADVQRPSSAVVQRVYEHFLQTFLGLTPEIYSQPSAEVISMLEYPELYTEALSLMTFCGILTKMFDDISCPGFSLRDIIKPDSGRFRSILYHAVCFANFRKEHVEIFEESNKQKEQLLLEKDHLEEMLQVESEKLNALKLQRTQEEPLVEAIREDLDRLRKEFAKMRTAQTSVSNDIENIKNERQTLKEKANSQNAYLTSLKQDINKLKSRIVENPERLFQTITDLNQTITNEKAALAAIDKKTRDLQAKIDAMTQIEQDLSKSIKMMDDVECQIKRLEETNVKIQQERERIAVAQITLKDLNAEDQHLKRQLANAQEKITKLQKQQIAKRESVEERLLQMKQEYDSLIVERENSQKKVEGNEKTCREIVSKMSESKKRHEQSIQQTVAVYDRLRLQVGEYCSEMKKVLSK